jgi:tetratricopeptide (TPR) repeat protein
VLEAEIASLLSNLAGQILGDAWTAVRPRLAVLLRLRGRRQDESVLGELEEARATAGAGDQDEARRQIEDLLRPVLDAIAAEQTSLVSEMRELLATTTAAAPARPLARIAISAMDDFENHDAELLAMDAALAAGRDTPGPTVLVAYGPRGIGLTTLARQFLIRHRDEFGTGPELSAVLARDADGRLPDAEAVLDGWFRLLHVPAGEVPADLPGKMAKFAQLTASGPVFVLLEDVALASQVKHFLPASAQGVVLVTSRQLPRSLAAELHATPFRIEPLPPEHSKRLLIRSGRLAQYAASHGAAIDTAVGACAGNPLLVRIAGAQMLFDQPYSIGEFVTALADRSPGTRLGAFDMDERSGAEIFDAGYRDLCRRAPDAAEVYRCLGTHPTGEFDEDVVAAMAPGLGGGARGRAIRTLMDASLVERAGGGLYRLISGLVHAHAAECARAGLTAQERASLRRRCVNYYVDLVERFDASLSPRHRHDPAGAYTRYGLLPADAQDIMVEELVRRRQILKAVVRAAHEAGTETAGTEAEWYYDATWRLAQGLWTFYLRCGFHADWIEVYGLACAAALECGDLLALARMHYGSGFAHLDRWARADPAAAREQFERALELVGPALRREDASAQETEGWRRTWSSVLEGMGLLENRLGDSELALVRFDEALSALDGVDHPRGKALIALHRGPVLRKLLRYDEADAVLVAARADFLALTPPDTFNAAKASARYGEVRWAAGRTAEALTAFDEAVAGLSKPRHGYQRAQILLSRGDLLHARGESGRARADWSAAAELFRAAGSERVEDAERRLTAGPDRPDPGPASPGGADR